jgi:N-methylhydantoinase B/oxoprolinase/acetone carboxylase alpha subunit
MSNTLNTPAEALELSYPLRVERYELRRESGGQGSHRGGDGVIREIRVLEPCRLSLLTQRRTLAPRGAEGGEDALPGRNFLNGIELPAIASVDLEPGDVLRIESPGGAGWGSARGGTP